MTKIEFAVLAAIIMILCALLYPAIQQAREAGSYKYEINGHRTKTYQIEDNVIKFESGHFIYRVPLKDAIIVEKVLR